MSARGLGALIALAVASSDLGSQSPALASKLLYECRVQAPPGVTADCVQPELQSAGDFDGDGRDDLLVTLWRHGCEPRSWLGECWNGEVEVRSGLDGSSLWRWPEPGNHACALAAAAAGDVDRDGRGDLIITVVSSQHETIPRVGLVAGGDGHVIRTLEADFENRFGYDSDGLPRCFGSEVGTLGDVDEDGAPDYFVGAPEQSTPLRAGGNAGHPHVLGRKFIAQPGNGIVDVYSGARGNRLWRQSRLGLEHGFAYSVIAVEDLDGDDAHDLVVGAPPSTIALVTNDADEGCLWTLSGKDGTVLAHHLGRSQDGGFGRSLLPVGDVDGDGSIDVGVGASQFSAAQEYAIIRLSDGEVLRTLGRRRLGSSKCRGVLRDAGDLDGDGRHELIEFRDPLLREEWVALCQPEVRVLDPLRGESVAQLPGEGGTGFGCSAGRAGDADADGRDDLAVCERLDLDGDRVSALIRIYGFARK